MNGDEKPPGEREKCKQTRPIDLSQSTDSSAHSSAHILSLDMHVGSIFNDVDATAPAYVTADAAYAYTYISLHT